MDPKPHHYYKGSIANAVELFFMNMVLRAEHYVYMIDLTLSLIPEPLKRKSRRIGRSLDFSVFAGAAKAFALLDFS